MCFSCCHQPVSMGLAEETVAPDGLHHPGTERGEILIELRRPLRHPIQLLFFPETSPRSIRYNHIH